MIGTPFYNIKLNDQCLWMNLIKLKFSMTFTYILKQRMYRSRRFVDTWHNYMPLIYYCVRMGYLEPRILLFVVYNYDWCHRRNWGGGGAIKLAPSVQKHQKSYEKTSFFLALCKVFFNFFVFSRNTNYCL